MSLRDSFLSLVVAFVFVGDLQFAAGEEKEVLAPGPQCLGPPKRGKVWMR